MVMVIAIVTVNTFEIGIAEVPMRQL